MRKTAWTRPASSLPSDRFAPRPQQQQQQPKKQGGGGGGKQKEAEPQKSAEVRRLEGLRDALRGASGSERDPAGGCFCQARMHPLSPYTPLCRACGLVLCTLHPPHTACPHCAAPLLSDDARAALAAKLDNEVEATLEREEDERRRAAEAVRAAQGAFPTLRASASPSPSPSGTPPPEQNQTHKVLSLDAKTRRVKVQTYGPSGSAGAKPTKKEKDKEAEPEYKRVPPPPKEVVCASRKPDAGRPWTNVRGLNVTYVQPARG